MDYINQITNSLVENTNTFVSVLGEYFFKVLLAVIVVFVGYIIAGVLKTIVKKAVKAVKLDSFLRDLDFDKSLEKAGMKLNSGKFLGELVKWVVFLIFFVVAVNILELTVVTAFLYSVLETIGNIVIAIIIFVAAVYAARFVKTIASSVAKAVNVESDKLVGNIAAFVIYLMAGITILGLFSVTREILDLIKYIVISIVAGFSLALGIAFGLGGKERAKNIIDGWRK
ncbi:hypothetical protein CSB11_02115 [Candidatus Campbellbacteria bacterium]|nr:MAG: hypothetical protein CSB11_02115 [Candidatus Campbellbacteria bacterium]